MPKTPVCCVFLLLAGSTLSPAQAVAAHWGGRYVLAQAQQPSAPAATESGATSPPAVEKLSLSDQVIQDVLEPLRTGIVGQDMNQIMSVFDKQGMRGYSNLQQQLRAFFELYSEVRFRYQILQVTADQDHGSATAQIEMDAVPYEVTNIPSHRSVQMRFKLMHTPKGWKIVGFAPADFFDPGFNRSDSR